MSLSSVWKTRASNIVARAVDLEHVQYVHRSDKQPLCTLKPFGATLDHFTCAGGLAGDTAETMLVYAVYPWQKRAPMCGNCKWMWERLLGFDTSHKYFWCYIRSQGMVRVDKLSLLGLNDFDIEELALYRFWVERWPNAFRLSDRARKALRR